MQNTGCQGCLHDYRTVMKISEILKFLYLNSKINQFSYLINNLYKTYI